MRRQNGSLCPLPLRPPVSASSVSPTRTPAGRPIPEIAQLLLGTTCAPTCASRQWWMVHSYRATRPSLGPTPAGGNQHSWATSLLQDRRRATASPCAGRHLGVQSTRKRCAPHCATAQVPHSEVHRSRCSLGDQVELCAAVASADQTLGSCEGSALQGALRLPREKRMGHTGLHILLKFVRWEARA